MMLSRDARELNCGRERERGSRRVGCEGDESGEACGGVATRGEDGEETGVWSISTQGGGTGQNQALRRVAAQQRFSSF